MKEPNMFDESFADSLRQLAPEVPTEVKSRLMYECGMAAAETKLRAGRARILAGSILGLCLAMGLGFVVGQQVSSERPQVATNEASEAPEQSRTDPADDGWQFSLPRMARVGTGNGKTLSAAMSFNRVAKLLDESDVSERSKVVEPADAMDKPFSIRSILNDMD